MDRPNPSNPGSLDDVLAHYGIRGMHWGKRKAASIGSKDPEAVSVYSSPGKRLRTSGGSNHPASDDAKQAAVSRQTARQSTVDALSNKDLQHLVGRLNLEANYAKIALVPKQKSAGRKFIEKLLKDEGSQFIVGKQGPMTKMVSDIMTAQKTKPKTAAKVATKTAAAASVAYKVRKSTPAEMFGHTDL